MNHVSYDIKIDFAPLVAVGRTVMTKVFLAKYDELETCVCIGASVLVCAAAGGFCTVYKGSGEGRPASCDPLQCYAQRHCQATVTEPSCAASLTEIYSQLISLLASV